MRTPTQIPKRIVYFRVARPAIDFALLLGALLVLMFLQNASPEQQFNETKNLRIQPNVLAEKALLIEEQFSTETSLWKAWGSWINTNQPDSGQCLIETKPAPIEKPFYLLCFGKQAPGSGSNRSLSSDILDNNVLVAPKTERATRSSRPTKTAAEPVYRVQGWMITRQGQKTFDPAQNKWLP